MAKEERPPVVKVIRKLRHWKQRFNRKAAFVWRKETAWPRHEANGKTTRVVFPAGSVIPPWVIATMGAKLRRFWESERIELLEFESPDVATGQAVARAVPETPPPSAPTKPKKKAARKASKKKARTKAASSNPVEHDPVPVAASAAD